VSGPNENRPRDAVVRDSPPPRILWLVRSDEYPQSGKYAVRSRSAAVSGLAFAQVEPAAGIRQHAGLIIRLRGLHLTGAAQVSALPPESAWQVLVPGLPAGSVVSTADLLRLNGDP